MTPSPASGESPAKPPESVLEMLQASYRDCATGDFNSALDKVNAIIRINSQNQQAYLLRGAIYAQQKQWDKADYDYEVARVLNPNNAVVKFDQAELKFLQKKYDDARLGFAELQGDKELGDLATYKIFLCDLLGSHEDVASRELDAFNEVGGNPSYYFGNAAWDLVHNKTDDASDWLKSANRIYANVPQKIANYTASLRSLGYLPLHASLAQ